MLYNGFKEIVSISRHGPYIIGTQNNGRLCQIIGYSTHHGFEEKLQNVSNVHKTFDSPYNHHMITLLRDGRGPSTI